MGVPGAVYAGVYFLRNLLFLRVSLLEPNNMILYCLVLMSAWTTTPRLSHLLGLLPSWFCTITWLPMTIGGSSLVHCTSL